MPIINGRYYMNPQYGAALERARAADEEYVSVHGTPQPSWLDRFLGFASADDNQEQTSQGDSSSGDAFRQTSGSGDPDGLVAQNRSSAGTRQNQAQNAGQQTTSSSQMATSMW